MAREIKFSLLYRDMWQSSGKYVPMVHQLKQIAPVIVDMGCFDRVETNGGAFEQVNLLFGENPNKAVREWTAPFNKAGIQTHMLERGLNALRMNPVPEDVRFLMYKVNRENFRVFKTIVKSGVVINTHLKEQSSHGTFIKHGPQNNYFRIA